MAALRAFLPERSLVVLPLKDRCLLRLFLDRGATTAELAGLLGTDWLAVRRRVKRLMAWLKSPEMERLLAAWPALAAEERRLLYLKNVLAMPLGRISRLGLVARGCKGRPASPRTATAGRGQGDGSPAQGATSPERRPASLSTLRRMLREIRRKVDAVASPLPDCSPPLLHGGPRQDWHDPDADEAGDYPSAG